MGAGAGEEKTICSSLINPLKSQLASGTFKAIMRMDAFFPSFKFDENFFKYSQKTRTKISHLPNGKITSRFLSGLDWF